MKLKIKGILVSLLLMVSAANAVCVQNDITPGSTVYGTWSSDCTSPVDGSSYYTQLYTFTLTETQEVQIDLSSIENTWINLIDDLGSPIASANGLPNTQLIMTLQAGTYTIDATTLDANVSGDFSLSLVTTTPTPIDPVALESFVSGKEFALVFEGYPFGSATFSSDYTYSDVQNGTDTCSGTWEVISNDTISTTCGVDYVFSGELVDGMTVLMNDTDPGSTGSVAVTFEETGTTTIPSTCTVDSITLDSNVSGSWSSGCESVHRTGSYAQYYTFTLTGTEAIQIDLESGVDTYLYLISDASGTVIAYNDDNGVSLNSRIITELPAGTYTIEATTYSAGVSGDFNLSLSRSTLTNYSFKGTINPPAQILALLQNCVDWDCPSARVNVNANLSNGNYQFVSAPVDYNDTTGQYEYQFDILADTNVSMDLYIDVRADWYDAAYNEYNSLYVQYAFGDDMAVGGVGSAADYPVENYCDPVMPLLHVETNTSLPLIEIDLSNYIVPIISQATMVLNNVPSDIEVNFGAYSPSICMYYGSYAQYNADGSRTIFLDGLRDGVEYGLNMFTYSYTTNINKEYRLNDNDGDFTNGGVFVEDMVYVESAITGYLEPVFDKMLLATPEDINISAPENLKFGNPASALPAVYLLLM